MAQKPGFVGRTFANIAGNAVMTSATIETGLDGTIVHVNVAIVALVSVDTNTRIASVGVMTRRSVLTNVRSGQAFVDILGTITTCIFGWTITGIGADSVNAAASVLAKMTVAIIYVDVAARAGEACKKGS